MTAAVGLRGIRESFRSVDVIDGSNLDIMLGQPAALVGSRGSALPFNVTLAELLGGKILPRVRFRGSEIRVAPGDWLAAAAGERIQPAHRSEQSWAFELAPVWGLRHG